MKTFILNFASNFDMEENILPLLMYLLPYYCRCYLTDVPVMLLVYLLCY